MASSVTLPEHFAEASKSGDFGWGRVAKAIEPLPRDTEPVRTAAILVFLMNDLERFAHNDRGLQVFYQARRSRDLTLDLPRAFERIGQSDFAADFRALRSRAHPDRDDLFLAWLRSEELDSFWEPVREISVKLRKASLETAILGWIKGQSEGLSSIMIPSPKRGLFGRLFGS